MDLKSRLLTTSVLLSVAGLNLSATTQPETRSPLRLLVVMGQSRYSPADLLKAAGLAINARVTPSEMVEACKTLAETGLFEKVNYRYTLEEDGYQLTLRVAENSQLYKIKISVPGTDESDLWADLKSRSPLFADEMPISSEAWYLKTLEQVLAARGHNERLTAHLQTDSKFSGKIEVIVSPAVSFREFAQDGLSGQGTIAAPVVSF